MILRSFLFLSMFFLSNLCFAEGMCQRLIQGNHIPPIFFSYMDQFQNKKINSISLAIARANYFGLQSTGQLKQAPPRSLEEKIAYIERLSHLSPQKREFQIEADQRIQKKLIKALSTKKANGIPFKNLESLLIDYFTETQLSLFSPEYWSSFSNKNKVIRDNLKSLWEAKLLTHGLKSHFIELGLLNEKTNIFKDFFSSNIFKASVWTYFNVQAVERGFLIPFLPEIQVLKTEKNYKIFETMIEEGIRNGLSSSYGRYHEKFQSRAEFHFFYGRAKEAINFIGRILGVALLLNEFVYPFEIHIFDQDELIEMLIAELNKKMIESTNEELTTEQTEYLKIELSKFSSKEIAREKSALIYDRPSRMDSILFLKSMQDQTNRMANQAVKKIEIKIQKLKKELESASKVEREEIENKINKLKEHKTNIIQTNKEN